MFDYSFLEYQRLWRLIILKESMLVYLSILSYFFVIFNKSPFHSVVQIKLCIVTLYLVKHLSFYTEYKLKQTERVSSNKIKNLQKKSISFLIRIQIKLNKIIKENIETT